MMMAQDSSSQPTYSLASYVYYPWVDLPIHPVPSTYGDVGRPAAALGTSPIVDGRGGLHGASASTGSSWDRSSSSLSAGGSNIGFQGTPLVLVIVVIHLVSIQLDNPNSTQPPNHRGRNQGSNHRGRNRGRNIDTQLPAPPSQTPLQVSVNTASGSGMPERAPKNTRPSTCVPQQPRGADPVRGTTPRHNLDSTARVMLDDLKLSQSLAEDSVDSELQIDIHNTIAVMRGNSGLSNETVVRQLEARTSQQPSTS